MAINICTKNELRTYSAANGKLTKVFGEVVDPRTKADLSVFCLDNRHRKCYVGDEAGVVRVLNISNGVFIKYVQGDDDYEIKKQQTTHILKNKTKERSEEAHV